MKNIEVNYTIEIEKVLEYWQSNLESLWLKRGKMDEEIEMIDNTVSYLRALKQAMQSQIRVIFQDESKIDN